MYHNENRDAERAIGQFHRDPTGMQVILRNGMTVTVKRWEDTYSGRRLRCASRSGMRKWVSEEEVSSVVWTAVSLAPFQATAGAGD